MSQMIRALSQIEREAYAEQQQALSVAAMAYQLHLGALTRLERVLTGGDPSLAIDPSRGAIVRRASASDSPVAVDPAVVDKLQSGRVHDRAAGHEHGSSVEAVGVPVSSPEARVEKAKGAVLAGVMPDLGKSAIAKNGELAGDQNAHIPMPRPVHP